MVCSPVKRLKKSPQSDSDAAQRAKQAAAEEAQLNAGGGTPESYAGHAGASDVDATVTARVYLATAAQIPTVLSSENSVKLACQSLSILQFSRSNRQSVQ